MRKTSPKKACRKCKFIVKEGNVCPNCGSTSLTTRWSGYIYVVKLPSQIADMINAKGEGEYAVIAE
jgi:RNA polymerase subunit RPABC4/transcription elongation factor Spt4